MDKEQIKTQVKFDMAGTLAINRESYGQYLDWLANEYSISRDEARDIAKEALT